MCSLSLWHTTSTWGSIINNTDLNIFTKNKMHPFKLYNFHTSMHIHTPMTPSPQTKCRTCLSVLKMSCTFEVNPTISGPRQLLICFMIYGLVLPFIALDISEIIYQVCFCGWLLRFGMRILRFIHVLTASVVCPSILLTSILLYEYTLLIYSSDQHLNCFLLLAIINKATTNIHV